MSYLPELRRSLVDAARREAHLSRSAEGDADGAPAPSRSAPSADGARRRLPHLWPRIGTVASLAAIIAALVIGVIAIGGNHGHTPATSTPAGGTPLSPAAQQALARKAADLALSRFRRPPGAVPTDRDPSSPARLGTPADTIQLPHVATFHRFWRAPGTVAAAAKWIQSHPPARAGLVSSQESASGPAPARGSHQRARAVIEMWGGTFTFASPSPAVTEQQLVVAVAPAAGGGVAIRADGQAGWLPLRPVAQQVPAGVDRIMVRISASSAQAGARARAQRTATTLPRIYLISDPRRIQRITALLNMLPPATRIRPGCGKHLAARIDAALYAPGQAVPLATARVNTGCATVSLTIPGRPAQTLSAGLPGAGQALLQAIVEPELLAGPVRSAGGVALTSSAGTGTRTAVGAAPAVGAAAGTSTASATSSLPAASTATTTTATAKSRR